MRQRYTDCGEKLSAASGINELMEDLGRALHGGGMIMMGGGSPAHIPAMEQVWRGRLEQILATPGAMETMLGDYDTPRGRPDFLETIAGFLRRETGWPVGPENIAVTTGSQAANFLLFNLLAGEAAGERRRILFPLVPEYIGYSGQGLTPDIFRAWKPGIELHGADTFKYRMQFQELTDDIAAMCVSRPTNPSSNIVTDDEVRRLSAMARERDVRLILDHAYGFPFPGVVFGEATMPEWEEHIVHTFSLSKLGLPATRTGIVVAEPEIIQRIGCMNAQLVLATGSMGEAITGPLFASGEIARLSREVIRPFYRERAQRTLAALRESFAGYEHYRVHECEGAFFLWLWLPRLPVSDVELYERLKRRGVLVVPGSYFFPGLQEEWEHTGQCIRLTYGVAETSEIQRGLDILAEEVKGLGEK